MKTQIKLIQTEDRWQTVDSKGTIYSNCKTKGDAKKVLKSKKWSDKLELVEEFTSETIKVTELEREFLNVIGFECELDESVYYCRLYDATSISEQQAPALTTSLIEKDLIVIDHEGTFDHCISATIKCIEALKNDNFEIIKSKVTKSPKKSVKTKKSDSSKKVTKSSYEERKTWLLKNTAEDELFGKSEAMKRFANHFNIKISKRGQCRSWDDLLIKMADNNDGIEYAEKSQGKRKRLVFKFTEEL